MKLTGLEKAVKSFCEIQRSHDDRYARLMCDVSTGEVWCDEFASGNSWINYTDNSIIYVDAELDYLPVNKTNVKNFLCQKYGFEVE